MLPVKAGQKTQLVGDIFPMPRGKYRYTWSILRGKSIASVDNKGVLTINTNAKLLGLKHLQFVKILKYKLSHQL